MGVPGKRLHDRLHCVFFFEIGTEMRRSVPKDVHDRHGPFCFERKVGKMSKIGTGQEPFTRKMSLTVFIFIVVSGKIISLN